MRNVAQEEDRGDSATTSTRNYCRIDLHVKTMSVCILDTTGQVLMHRNVPSTPAAFLEVVGPYRTDLVVAAEGITFVLGHALAMTAIHGGKAKNDKIDSHQIAVLLRGERLAHIQNTVRQRSPSGADYASMAR